MPITRKVIEKRTYNSPGEVEVCCPLEHLDSKVLHEIYLCVYCEEEMCGVCDAVKCAGKDGKPCEDEILSCRPCAAKIFVGGRCENCCD